MPSRACLLTTFTVVFWRLSSGSLLVSKGGMLAVVATSFASLGLVAQAWSLLSFCGKDVVIDTPFCGISNIVSKSSISRLAQLNRQLSEVSDITYFNTLVAILCFSGCVGRSARCL